MRLAAATFAVAIVGNASAAPMSSDAEEAARALALDRAAQTLDVAADEVTSTSEGVIQPWGVDRFFVGTYETASGNTTAVWVDLATLAVYDRNEFWAATEEARKNLGKYTPDVRATLDNLADGDKATVAITYLSDWRQAALASFRLAAPNVKLSEDGRPDTGDDKLNQEIAQELRDLRKAALVLDREPILGLLKEQALTVEYAAELVPMIWITGSKSQIEAVTASPLVVNTLGSYKTELASWSEAYDNIQAGDAYSSNFRGQGTTVAVVEYNNVKWDIPTLSSIPSSDYDNFVQGNVPPHVDGHPTWVMAAIASRTSGRRGVAPNAHFLSSSTVDGHTDPNCETCDFNIIAAVEKTFTNPQKPDPDVINLSIVADSGQNGHTGDGAESMKVYLDNLVATENIHVAAAGGDDFTGFRQCSNANSPKRVQEPGGAWNVVAAGLTKINGSGWADDQIFFEAPSDGDPAFCWGNNPGNPGDPVTRVKPELAAPGQGVTFPDSYLFGYESGTSITSPQIAGTMSVLIGEDPTNLRSYPEVVRAVIVASSDVHQTEPSHNEDDYEGWGTLSVKWATELVKRNAGRGDFGRRNFAATGQAPHYGAPGSLYQNLRADYNRARFVISWNSHGIYDQGGCDDTSTCSDERMTDFDIHVTNAATGAFVKDCLKPASNYEVCSWASTPGTTYHIVMDPVEWNRLQPAETVGWAFMSHNDQ
ncbi:MAG TPA: hypothetical protein VFL75_10560 [Candidatus Limnocylindria bacterium]|nr:hypothetical protein [Candidatus Limnocylindria bacterium]